MGDSSSKIITTFQDRLALDTAVRSLAQTTTAAEARQRAAEIAAKFGDRAIPALVRQLDTTDPQMRGGLGMLAAMLDYEKTTTALRAAARNRALDDQARLTAITILDRYLNIAPDEDMYHGMGAPEESALRSLREALADQATDPLVLVEYFRQLEMQPLDVQLTMARAARRLDAAEAVPMLRMFAQAPTHLIAQESLQALGVMGTPEAAGALHGLIPTLRPDLRFMAERALQKLRLRGLPVPPLQPPAPGFRCLATPPDSRGGQYLLFIVPLQGETPGLLMRLAINPVEGLIEATASAAESTDDLPEPLAVGALHASLVDLGHSLWLEAPYDYGRRRAQTCLAVNLEEARPLPYAYRYLNWALWQWTPPAPHVVSLEVTPAGKPDLGNLLRYPALAGWYLNSPKVFELADQLLGEADRVTPQRLERVVAQLITSELAAGALDLGIVRDGLVALQEWLILAGRRDLALQAQSAARSLADAPEKHPLLLHMANLGLRIAMITLARGLQQGWPPQPNG
ncbi:MAG: hypothetical protein R2844_04270 [Caldilineales bacterium]